jgi:xanthine dehydrogenase iron-sulfur cluster and FAD-binding subunit A
MSKKGNPGSTVGGEDWQKGDITTIHYAVANDRDVQNGIAAGFITLLNQIGFDSTRLTISSETSNAALLTQKYGSVRISAQSKYEALITAAAKKRQSALDELTSRYEDAKAELEAQADAAETSLLAAKRASRNPTDFDKAFSVAYKFEYNRVMLTEIADLPWTGNWSFRTINSLIKVTNLADLGDSIASKYSYKEAASFNSRVGTAFTNEPDFRAVLKIVSAIYKKTTNTSIKV